ncbi:Oidioi.mRNA.OKI2018_I69.PAR.g10558.t1.cds [Oikopleura dioica]|uniref:Oidioi.mRNA.OKI2018_I69.PAR.g10558.t1.cds n=1 Tax=Oikopleura dioica TaxID=34765 RepID=A0ABN7RYR4_OIKDI|nr:Oidioi.mRNA.OKI2018_I69.PAR.g10558.t1.cds [Oikopleura dioica]
MSLYLSYGQSQIEQLEKVITEKNEEAERFRKHEHFVASTLQNWWRNCVTKIRERKRTRASNMVVGFLRKVVTNKKMDMIEKHKEKIRLRKQYGEYIIPFQALWRGYHSRKTVMDFYKRKELLEAVALKNEETRAHLQKVRNMQLRMEKWRRASYMANARKSIHYLISTRARPGVPEQIMEKTAEETAALKKKKRHSVEPLVIVQPLPSPRRYKNYSPPDDLECFGPFRRKESDRDHVLTSRLVQMQKHRPLEPTLRVLTSYNTTEREIKKDKQESWMKSIQDKPMKFATASSKCNNYERTLWGQTAYNPRDFNRTTVRDESQCKNKLPFISQVPSIPLFDRLGKSYAERSKLMKVVQ